MPRVEPVSDKSQVAPEYQHVADGVLKVFGAFRGPHSILLLAPGADEQALGLGNYFRYDSVIKSPEKELAIITAMRERDSLYVWAAQVAAGLRGGMRPEAVEVIKNRRDPSELLPQEAEIVTYVQQLCRKNRVDQPVFDALKNRYGTQWLVEMTTVVGYYSMLGGIVNAFEVAPPADGDVLPV